MQASLVYGSYSEIMLFSYQSWGRLMQTMAELQFHFGVLAGHEEMAHISLDTDCLLYVFLDGSAIYIGEKTMTVIPDIWGERQEYHLEHCLPMSLRRERS